MDKYQNKYRIPSARMQGYDYGQNGAYFITICTHNREHYFGSIVNRQMVLNELGLLAEKYWHEIPQHFPFVHLGNFVVMPNHVHGVLVIDKINNGDVGVPDNDTTRRDVACNVSNENDDHNDDAVETLHCNVSTTENDDDNEIETLRCNVSTGENDTEMGKNEHMAKISPQAGSVSTIIRSYKSVVSKNARFIHATFAWQARFHDHIIRTDVSFNQIQQYILTNPQHWDSDSLFK